MISEVVLPNRLGPLPWISQPLLALTRLPKSPVLPRSAARVCSTMAATTKLQELATLASRVTIAPATAVLAFCLRSPICSSRRWSATAAQFHVAAFALILPCLIVVAFALFPSWSSCRGCSRSLLSKSDSTPYSQPAQPNTHYANPLLRPKNLCSNFHFYAYFFFFLTH